MHLSTFHSSHYQSKRTWTLPSWNFLTTFSYILRLSEHLLSILKQFLRHCNIFWLYWNSSHDQWNKLHNFSNVLKWFLRIATHFTSSGLTMRPMEQFLCESFEVTFATIVTYLEWSWNECVSPTFSPSLFFFFFFARCKVVSQSFKKIFPLAS